MFRYFARLSEKHDLPIYPIALFTYGAPMRAEPDTFEVAFPNHKVLTFQFKGIQLNRLNWRDFVRRPNPVAAALMTKMRIAPQDRPRVKLECLRLLATLKLDKARQGMIRDFMDAYLRLSAEELNVYDRELQTIDPPQREAVMQIVNEWEARGEARGEASGQANIIVRLLQRRFGALPAELEQRIRALATAQSSQLGEALLDFASFTDVEAWLATHS